jgi:hypothetical protein
MQAMTLDIATSSSHSHPMQARSISWPFLCERLKRVIGGAKEGRGWVAANIPDGPRANDRVISTSLLVFDIDNKGSVVTQAELEMAIRDNGYRAILHSTYNHTPDNPRFRLVLDISEPIKPADHKSLLLHIAQNLGITDFIDTACTDLSRYFYLPRCPIQRIKDYVFWSIEGDPVDIEACLDRIKFDRKSLEPQPSVKIESEVNAWEENESNIAKIKEFLGYCSADCEYEKWRNIIWSVTSLGWDIGADLIRDWSKTSLRHWVRSSAQTTDEVLQGLIESFDPERDITIGTLIAESKSNGWTPISPFDVLNEIEDFGLAQSVTTQKYKLLNRNEILALPPLEWRVKDVLPTRGVAAIYGPSGSGKSFLAIDVATAICLGTDWFGNKCKPTSVIYIGLEGSAGIQNRVKAWEIGRGKRLPTNFSAVLADFDLTNAADIQAIIDQTPKASVLIIDTLNRATPGRDENSSSDMGLTLAGAKSLEQGIEGLVVLIHHTGKDQSRGPRGHSSLYGALDAALVVTKTGGTKTWSQGKLKDGPDEEKFSFRLQSHVVGRDEDGTNETSCTVEPEPSALQPQRPPTPKGSQQKPAYEALKTLVDRSPKRGRGGALFHTCCVNLDSAVKAITETLGTVDQGKRSNRAKTLIDSFVSAEFLIAGLDESGNAWYWLPE